MICVIVFLKAALLPSEASRTPPEAVARTAIK